MSLVKRYLQRYHKHFTRSLSTTGYKKLDKLLFDDDSKHSDYDEDFNDTTIEGKQNRARSIKVLKYFSDEPHLRKLKGYVPSQYFVPKRRLTLQHLYLLDKKIAKSVVAHMLPCLHKNKKQVICETNAGLGLIASELLDNGIESLRLYESCNEFREILKYFKSLYPNRVELFDRDLFHLSVVSNADKYSRHSKVDGLLKGIPKKDWNDDPAITIVGAMPSINFLHYLIKRLTVQQEIIQFGRTQIFALMKPRDYLVLTAVPDMSLHTYRVMTILFRLFFDIKLIEKYPRKSFLPWETNTKSDGRVHFHSKVDLDYIYLVEINFKKVLPVKNQHLLQLYYFVKQGFHRGRTRVIPTVENWIPGIGLNLIVPKPKYKNKCFQNMSIFTEFGELSPTQILQIFLEMLEHPEYNSSPFVALVESQLLNSETIDNDLADANVVSGSVENLQQNIR